MRDVLGIALPGNYDTVLLLDWQGLEQYPVHDAEKGRTHPDTEGKHKHSNKKESWMSHDHSGGLRTFPRKFRDGFFHFRLTLTAMPLYECRTTTLSPRSKRHRVMGIKTRSRFTTPLA